MDSSELEPVLRIDMTSERRNVESIFCGEVILCSYLEVVSVSSYTAIYIQFRDQVPDYVYTRLPRTRYDRQNTLITDLVSFESLEFERVISAYA